MADYVTVRAGGDAPLLVTFDLDLDAGTPRIVIKTAAGVTVVASTAVGLASAGSGVYAYVWSVPALTAAGTYVATFSGEIDAEAVSEAVTITVTSRYTYVSLADLRDEMSITATGGDARLRRALEGASQAIEDHCCRERFYRDGSVSVRRYLPDGRIATVRGIGQVLLVDDIATMTGLVVEWSGDGITWSTVSATTIRQYPDNALTRGRAVEGLVIVGGTWLAREYRVTADWGWPAVPTAVEGACMLQAMRLSRRHTTPEGVMGSAEFGGPMRIPRLDPDVASMLQRYVKISMG